MKDYSLCLLTHQKPQSGHSIDSLDDDYDCDVPPPLSVEPFTCCKVSKPFDRINFPECFAPPPPPPTSKIYVRSSTLSPPIPVSEDFHDDYTPSPTRSSIFKKKFKPAQYQTSTNRPIWPSYYHPDDDRSSSSSVISDSTYSNDGQDYDKSHKIHYYHHHGDSNGDGDGSSGGGRSGGYGHWWPGKYQHWGYHHSSSRHRRGAPNYNINNARTSNVSS